jgi:hypothetical protein
MAVMRRVAPAIALYFLSPFVAEFLLGDFPITMLPLILVLGPMYGGGALLIREVTRRTHRGWPTMILLAVAFGVIEEGLVTQSLFNKDYVGAHLLDRGYIPALGIAIPWTIFVLTIHTVWSIATPIAIVEESTRGRREEPWLRRFGLVVAAVLFGLGALLVTATSYADGHYLAPVPNLVAATVVALTLIVVAFRLPRRRPADAAGGVPAGGWFFSLVLAAGAVLMTAVVLPVWLGVAAVVAIEATVVTLVLVWSRRAAWGAWQRIALAIGALVTYAWHGFTMRSLIGGSTTIDLVSHITFAVAALAIIWYAVYRTLRREPAAPVAGSTVDAVTIQ